MTVLAQRERDHHDSAEAGLRERYEELRELRETLPEKEAARMHQAMQKVQATADKVIKDLRQQLEQQRSNATEALQGVTMAESLHAENEKLRAELQQARAGLPTAPAAFTEDTSSRQLVAFYEMMTGMRVRMERDVAHCTLCAASDDATKRHTVGFELNMAPPEDGELGYKPTNLTECAERLPEYLQDEITCALAPPHSATMVDAALRNQWSAHFVWFKCGNVWPDSRQGAGAGLPPEAPRRDHGGRGGQRRRRRGGGGRRGVAVETCALAVDAPLYGLRGCMQPATVRMSLPRSAYCAAHAAIGETLRRASPCRSLPPREASTHHRVARRTRWS